MAWRVGTKVPINIYDGDRPVCQCQTAADAARIVAAVNAVGQIAVLWASERVNPAVVGSPDLWRALDRTLKVVPVESQTGGHNAAEKGSEPGSNQQ
jgi:hypothetical protein